MGFGGLLSKSTTTYSDEEILSSSVKSQLGLGADATPSDAFALLGQSVASGARIVTGSYVGNGNFYQPVIINTESTPKVVVISTNESLNENNRANTQLILINPMTYASSGIYSTSVKVTWLNNGISFICTNSSSGHNYNSAFNNDGWSYYYVAFL